MGQTTWGTSTTRLIFLSVTQLADETYDSPHDEVELAHAPDTHQRRVEEGKPQVETSHEEDVLKTQRSSCL